jgi:hypothetical protein
MKKVLIPVLLQDPEYNTIHFSEVKLAAGVCIVYTNPKEFAPSFRVIETPQGLRSVNFHGELGGNALYNNMEEVLAHTEKMGNQVLLQLNGDKTPLHVTRNPSWYNKYLLYHELDFTKGVLVYEQEGKFVTSAVNELQVKCNLENGCKVYQLADEPLVKEEL